MVSHMSGLLLEKAQPVIGEMTSQMSLLQVYAYLAVDAVLVCADLCVPLQSLCRCSFPAPGHFRSYHRYVEFCIVNLLELTKMPIWWKAHRKHFLNMKQDSANRLSNRLT